MSYQVVEQNSAVLGLEFPKEAQYLVPESNHSSICKFKYKDQNYEVIEDHLDDLVKYSLERKLLNTSLGWNACHYPRYLVEVVWLQTTIRKQLAVCLLLERQGWHAGLTNKPKVADLGLFDPTLEFPNSQDEKLF
jgi:hypothetical protein